MEPRILPVGDAAVTVELGDGIDAALAARVRALDRALAERPIPGVTETAPTYRSLLVTYDPSRTSREALCDAVRERVALTASLEEQEGPLRTIPVAYGGDDGPDLPEVARRHGSTEAKVVELHVSLEYRALMLGFLPGFAYLGFLPEALDTPRRATPRPRVPGGSVAVAGRQTAAYPFSSPGGWNLIGRTTLRLFDPTRDPPALILPGDRVRFVAGGGRARPDATAPPAAPAGPWSAEVLEPGLLTTVQDAGRFGWRRLGVPWSGALDRPSLEAANRAVGNAPGAAGLECTLLGPTLRFLAPTRFSIAGADLEPVLERADLGAWPVPLQASVFARPGNVLRFLGRRRGCRAYLAFAGGIDVPQVLGSRSTDLTAGFGGHEGRALGAGDRLASGLPTPERASASAGDDSAASETISVRVVLGPQDGHLTGPSRAAFLSETWSVTAASDRVGCRLEGPRLVHGGPSEIVTDGMVPGCVQVPPDGQPIVMLAGGPTSGGYPKIATVITSDLPLLAQLAPGEGRVRFVPVDPRPRG